MKTSPELEVLMCGAVHSAPSVEDAKKVVEACGLVPGDMVDPLARADWALSLEMLQRGELPSSYAVWTEGRLRNVFSDKERSTLEAWEAAVAMSPSEMVQVGRQLRRAAHGRKLGDQLRALSALVFAGRTKEGNSFGPNEAEPYFQAIWKDYRALHTDGRTAADALLSVRADYERRKSEGRARFTKSGLPALDKLIGGYPHKLVWVVGAPGRGKTTFIATQIDLHASMGLKGSIASLEDNDSWLVERHVALRTGMKQREVYSEPFPDDVKAAQVEQELYDRWKGLWVFTKQNARTAADVVRLFTQQLIQLGSTVFYLDNFSKLQHVFAAKGEEMRSAAGRSVDVLAEFADVFKMPVLVLAHTNRAYFERCHGHEPPAISDTNETGDADRFARLGLGVWTRGEQLRLTINKFTAQGALEGRTVAFNVHVDQGLCDVDSGHEVNLHEEKRLAAEDRARSSQRKKDAESDRVRQRNADIKRRELERKEAERKAVELATPAQGDLLGGGT